MLCVAGSLTIVLHAPEETPITSLLQVWQLAMQPGESIAASINGAHHSATAGACRLHWSCDGLRHAGFEHMVVNDSVKLASSCVQHG